MVDNFISVSGGGVGNLLEPGKNDCWDGSKKQYVTPMIVPFLANEMICGPNSGVSTDGGLMEGNS